MKTKTAAPSQKRTATAKPKTAQAAAAKPWADHMAEGFFASKPGKAEAKPGRGPRRPDAERMKHAKSAKITFRATRADSQAIDKIRRNAPGRLLSASEAVKIAIRAAADIPTARLWTLLAELEAEDLRRTK